MLSSEEIYKLYCSGRPITYIADIVKSSDPFYSKVGAQRYVERVIVNHLEQERIDNLFKF